MTEHAEPTVFERIAAREIPAQIVAETDRVIAFHDIAPKAPTHVLLIPRRHIPSVAELSGVDSEMLGRLFTVSAQVARDAGVAKSGYRMVTNSGAGAGQSVFHLHFHLLGGRSMSWPPG